MWQQVRVFSTEQMQDAWGRKAVRPKISWNVLMYSSPQGHKGHSVSSSVLSRCVPTPTERLPIWTRCTSLSPQPMVSLPDSLQNCSNKPIASSCRNRGSPDPLVTTNPAFHSLCSLVCHCVALHRVQCLCPYTHPLDYVTNKLLSIFPVQYQSVRCSTNLNYFGQRISLIHSQRWG